MITIHPKAEKQFSEESNFEIFKHGGLICCVIRISHSGCLNGYVAVNKEHPLFGKKYGDKIKLDKSPKFNGNYIGLLISLLKEDYKENLYSLAMAINVHGGLTYSSDTLHGIDKDLFGELWWLGFDTMHSGDLKPLQSDIDRKYMHSESRDEYRDFEFVKEQTKSLAEQLINFSK